MVVFIEAKQQRKGHSLSPWNATDDSPAVVAGDFSGDFSAGVRKQTGRSLAGGRANNLSATALPREVGTWAATDKRVFRPPRAERAELNHSNAPNPIVPL